MRKRITWFKRPMAAITVLRPGSGSHRSASRCNSGRLTIPGPGTYRNESHPSSLGPDDPARLVRSLVLAVSTWQTRVATAIALLCFFATSSLAASVSLVSPPDQSVLNTLATTFTASITASSPLVSATLYVGGVPQTTVLSGPVQVEDAEISTSQPDTSNGTGTSINVDGQNPHAHGLIKFPGLLGYGTGQIPHFWTFR